MKKDFDLNKLYKWAKYDIRVSLDIHYSEADDSLEVKVCSPARDEEFYMKRVPSVEYFIEAWGENLRKNLELE